MFERAYPLKRARGAPQTGEALQTRPQGASNYKMNLRWKIAQAAEIRWWSAYMRNRAPAHYLEKKSAYWRKVLREAGVSLKPGEWVLDAGCGPAGVFIILEDQRVDAVDPLLRRYEMELPVFRQELYPHVRFISSPFEEFEPEGLYDTVFCMNALNHFADISLSVEKLLHSVRPGGQLIVSVDAHNFGFLKKTFRLLPGDVLHPHQYDLQEYLDFFERPECRLAKKVRLKKGRIFDYWMLCFSLGV
jgi:SAM-dependent methyltransferase